MNQVGNQEFCDPDRIQPVNILCIYFIIQSLHCHAQKFKEKKCKQFINYIQPT